MHGRAAFLRYCILLSGMALPFSIAMAQPPDTMPSFDVEITLSQKAAAKLSSLSEGMVIAATYAGDPVPGAEKHANQIGQIDLGRQTIDISGRPQFVLIPAPHIRHDALSEIRGPILLNVNVYSARRHGPDNILSCDFFDGNLEEAVHKHLSLHCSLVGEMADTINNSGTSPIPPDRVADSYAIYAMLLPGASADTISPSHVQHWSLADTTVSIADMNPAIPPDGQLKAPPENVKGFNEAVQDYNVRRYQRFQLNATDFHPSHPPPLVNDEQVASLRRSGSNNNGVAFFSAVYFNSAQNAALVYVNAWCANLCAVGQWVYLEKQGSRWVRRSGLMHGGG